MPSRSTVLIPRAGALDVPAVTAALAERFRVEAHTRRAVRVRSLDTFDRRLAKAGLTLQLRTTGGTDELVLADGERELTAAADGLRLPALAAALPAGPVRDRLAPVLDVRALTDLGTQRRHQRLVDLRNSDDKIVVRVTVDEPDQVRVTPLRGYDSAGRTALRLLGGAGLRQAEAGVAAPDEPAGEAPGPDSPATTYVAHVLRGFLDTMTANLPGLLDDVDTEFLHDFRVSVRRSRSTLKLGRPVLPGDLRETWEPAFRWLGDLTTPVRDLDVYQLDLPTMASWLVAADPGDLGALAEHLRRRRTAERRRLVRGLRSPRYRRFVDEWDSRLTRLSEEEPPGSETALSLARSAIRRSGRRVMKDGSAVHADSAATDLHDLRKRCKELRYALEVFAPVLDTSARKTLVTDLKVLQDVLGRFQDTEVQRAAMRDFAEEMMQDGTPTEAVLALGELIGHLDAAQDDARREFDDAFGRFARPANRRRLDDLAGRS
ncbi:MAG TPA: CHAD domain-containing protein [Actinomycetes bacterium]|nr:CHAD domain-containing protein [Actinomycetes bacterium]